MCNSVRSTFVNWLVILLAIMLSGCGAGVAPAANQLPEIAPVAGVAKLQAGEAMRGFDMTMRGVAETIKATNGAQIWAFWPTARDANGAPMLWGRACVQGLCNKPAINGAAMDTDTLRTTLATLSAAGYQIKIHLLRGSTSMGDFGVLMYNQELLEQLEWQLNDELPEL